ncbi:MAG TPA: metallophosphoesterase [Myxococcales bacterium]|nr:metallophosphoesterase [Myxococcales bacterium]
MRRLIVIAAALPLAACGNSSGGKGSDAGTDAGAGGPLVFAIVGDTRPANPCPSTSNCPYPTAIITEIYKDMTQVTPAPQIVVGTGDYMYNDPGTGTASWQVQQYLTAEAQISVPFYPAMGNHECTGYTSSECGSDNSDGVTENFTAFLSGMLGGLKLPNSTPYYVETVPAGPGQTAKFVFMAANAWDQTQSTWLDATLAQPTTYTFVIRHEPSSDARDCPGITPSDQIISAHPLTLKIVGHSHEYSPYDSTYQEVIVGNGGAPLDSGSSYGFVLCQQRSDGAIQCADYDYQSNAPTGTAFALTAAGQSTPTQ